MSETKQLKAKIWVTTCTQYGQPNEIEIRLTDEASRTCAHTSVFRYVDEDPNKKEQSK